MSSAHWLTVTLIGARSNAKLCDELIIILTKLKPLLGPIKIESQLTTMVKCTIEQISKQTIMPGVGFGAPSLAKHLVTRSMVRCPFARQVCTTMQTYTRNAVQSLNQRPLTNGFTNCRRQANLRGHKHSSNFYSSSMSAQR